MRRSMIGLLTLGCLAATASPAPAAWNNVFQPTLFHRDRQPAAVSQYYVPPTTVVAASSPCDPCQRTVCSTNYVQRCFYQPVTVYETKTYYEPVTTYKTSYYYEPVTTYRYSCYYDPCTCSYQQVATPCTSYQLRSQCCPVQSWVQRCCQVPVTAYQKCCYWQPQTTCCTTTTGAPIPITGTAPPQVNSIQTPAPSITQPSGSPPNIEEKKTPGAGMGKSMYDRLYPPSQPQGPFMPPASLKQPAPPPPSVKLEGIVMGPDSRVEGQVVHNDRTPKANAKVMFVGVQGGQRLFTATNAVGRFNVELPAGNWNVYLYGSDDLPVYSTQLSVDGRQQPFTLVSR